MTNREITIGRDNYCDIILSGSCAYASGKHATMYMDGHDLMYRDMSKNGTWINNNTVHNRAVPVRHGDSIMIAGKYPLSWNEIDRYFVDSKNANPTTQTYDSHFSATNETPRFGWNWGAFALYPIWGFFNGCWWGILIAIFFGWSVIPNFIFGAMGSKWAWENRSWISVSDFEETQSTWSAFGLGLFIFNIVVLLFFIMAFIAIL